VNSRIVRSAICHSLDIVGDRRRGEEDAVSRPFQNFAGRSDSSACVVYVVRVVGLTPWTVVTDGNYSNGKIAIEDDNSLSFDYIQTTTGKVFDTSHLYRDHSAYDMARSCWYKIKDSES
jgi:hypothetical protein